MIPKILHLIWVGDETRRPARCIQSWIQNHPDWVVREWGNRELDGRDWINASHIKDMAGREWNGVADMMRWEILFDEGGVLVDADSFCLRPLPDWVLECEAFTCWENELVRPGLLAAGYFGSVPRTPFLANLIEGIRVKPTVIDRMAWESVGPLHLTETWRGTGYGNLTVLPSHFFIPRHFTGVEYSGTGPVFARQEWGSTLRCYDHLASETGKAQAFLFEPVWGEAEWVEVVLSYLQAFSAGEPVALVLVLDPAARNQIPLAEAEQAVLQIVASTGRDRFPDIILSDNLPELPGTLRRFPLACWVPPGQGNTLGFRGALGARFAEARSQMAEPS